MRNTDYDYYLHLVRRNQDANNDHLTLVSAPKGAGKSSASILMARRELELFSFICPHCKWEFFKNVYIVDGNDPTRFIVHPEIENDEGWIRCDEEWELDAKTNTKVKVGGCGKLFKWSQRRKIKWDTHRFVAYDNKDMENKLFSTPKGAPIVADEAIKFAASMNHNKAENKAMKELFVVIRPRNLHYYFCVPDISMIDSKYREDMSHFWLRLIERGKGILFEKDTSEREDKWHLKEMEKLMGVIKTFTPLDKISRNLQKHPCYFDTMSFPELPEEIYDEYEYIRNSINLQRRAEELQVTNKDMAKIMSYNLIHNWDRIKIAVDRNKDARVTYDLIKSEVLTDPVSRKALVSDMTIRNWVKGVEEFVRSKGADAQVFAIENKEQTQEVVEEDEVIEL